MTVKLGHIDRFWDDGYKSLSYSKKRGFDELQFKIWEDVGYHESNVKSLTGWDYDNSNPMPDWVDQLTDKFSLYRQTYTFYRMDTLEIMPLHSDHFRTYCKINEVVSDQVHRAVLMLEDWQSGHYLEIDGKGYVNWKAGDWFMWNGTTPHIAANIGIEPRYSLQITGILTT